MSSKSRTTVFPARSHRNDNRLTESSRGKSRWNELLWKRLNLFSKTITSMVISQRYDWSRFIPSMGQNHEKFTAHHRNAANRIESRHVQKSTVWQIHLAAFGPTKITACHQRFIIADRQHVFTPLNNWPLKGIRVFLMKMSWHFKAMKTRSRPFSTMRSNQIHVNELIPFRRVPGREQKTTTTVPCSQWSMQNLTRN